MEIVDNSPEMDLADPKFAEMLAGVTPKEEKPADKPVEKTDVKQEEKASSASEPKVEEVIEEDSDQDETPDKLKARIRGLQAELTRRKGNAEKVNELEVQLARVQGQLETLNRPSPKDQDTEIDAALKKLDEKALVSKEVDWNDELTDARTRYANAEERGDEKAMEKQAARIVYAKKVLSAIKVEASDRRERNQTEADKLRTEQAKVKTELDSMYSTLTEKFPDFQDKESELWKAGDAEYKANPEIMKRLGPAGEVVAAALAVLKNPHLANQRTEADARHEVVTKLEQGMKKSLKAGAASPTTGRMVIPKVETGEGLAAFNTLVDRIKGG